MAWGDKNKTPEELLKEHFNMTPAEFEQFKADREAEKARLAQLEAEAEQQRTQFEAVQSELAALRESNKPRTEHPEPTNFFEDPDRAINERLAPLAQYAAEGRAGLEEMRARQRFAKDFTLWGKEIEDLMAKENVAAKANPQFWENVVNIVRGRHAAEIEESAAKGQFYFTEQPGGAGVGGAHETPESKLSSEELAAAKRLGMSAAEFSKYQSDVYNMYGHTKGARA